MKRSSLVAVSLIVLAAISAPAAPRQSTTKVTEVPGILANARYVYVACYDRRSIRSQFAFRRSGRDRRRLELNL